MTDLKGALNYNLSDSYAVAENGRRTQTQRFFRVADGDLRLKNMYGANPYLHVTHKQSNSPFKIIKLNQNARQWSHDFHQHSPSLTGSFT